MRTPGRTVVAVVIALCASQVAMIGPLATPAAAATVAVDRAQAAGVFNRQKSWAASTVDYDNDGDQDVWIGFHQWSGMLFSNDGDGTYTRVAASAWPRTNSQGRVPDRHDCTFADVDGNGLADSYCSAGRNQSNRVKYGMDNELWMQTSRGVFQDRAQENINQPWGVGELCGRGRHVAFLDYNRDGYPDLFVGNETPRNVSDPCDNPSNGLPNEEAKLFRNNGGTGFTYVRNGIGGFGPGQRCAEVIDINSDGWDDLVTCRLRNQVPRLYRNNGGVNFTEVASGWGLTQALADAVVADLNGDGRQDLVTASVGGFDYRLNTGTRFATPVRIRNVSTGDGRSVAVGDADADGDLDVYCMVRANGSNPNDVIMLNNGNLTFTALNVPAAGGDGDEVIALDPLGHRPGRQKTEFLVLNGGEVVGPVQLIRVNVT